jgi:hypothetical protein
MFSITEIINVDEKSDPQNKDRNTINGYILVHFFVYVYIYTPHMFAPVVKGWFLNNI